MIQPIICDLSELHYNLDSVWFGGFGGEGRGGEVIVNIFHVWFNFLWGEERERGGERK
jgi:hypothetical protein